jgi:hypothetical protein
VTTLQIKIRMPEIADMLHDRGWLEEWTDDQAVLGKALSAALAAWLADPERDPLTLPVKDQQTVGRGEL